MCGPLEAIMFAGSAISAMGSIQQGKTAKAMGDLQGNAYDQQAENTRRAAGFEAMRELHKQELTAAQARAQVGASGVAFEGSTTDALVANAGQGQLDIEAIKYGAALKSGQLRTQGALARYGGQQAQSAGYIAGASTVFSGTANAVRMGTTPFARSDATLYDLARTDTNNGPIRSPF